MINNFNEFLPYIIFESFTLSQFELDIFVDVNDKEKACEWFIVFKASSKITMLETKHYDIKEKQVLFRKIRHCIHSNTVKKKQGVCEVKWPRSSQLRNINCVVTIHICLEN